MSAEFIAIFIFSLIGLAAHGSRHFPWIQWGLRGLYVIFLVGEILFLSVANLAGTSAEIGSSPSSPLVYWSWACAAVLTALLLFKSFREALSRLLTALNQFVNGQLIVRLIKRESFRAALMAEPVFVAASVPHMNGLWIYVTCVAYILSNIEPGGFQMPQLPIPIPVTIDQLFMYNGLGLVMLAVCGVGILVARRPGEVLSRLGFEKPKGWQIGLGIFMIFFTYLYDYLWSEYTHKLPGEIAPKISNYNDVTFSTNNSGSAGSAGMLAICTAVFAGVGEETLIRGALQPVLGIVPAAFLHGVLHAQFAHAPMLILQVTGWSIIMGIVRRYTNTTTTVITHATFNFLSVFLFAFNPQ